MADQETFLQEENNSTEPKVEKQVGTGSIVAAFIVFAISLLIFAVFVISSSAFLSELFKSSRAGALGEALGAIITIIFASPFVIISAIPSFLFTLLSFLLFRRIQGGAASRAGNIAFRVFYGISLAIFILGILLGIFILIVLFAR